MKQFITTIILLTGVKCGWSQEAKPQLKLRPYVADTAIQVFPKPIWKAGNLSQSDSSYFSHFTSTVTVYTLPQDNMPWLKPNHDLVDNMPVKSDAGNSNMPNAYRAMPGKLKQLLNRKP